MGTNILQVPGFGLAEQAVLNDVGITTLEDLMRCTLLNLCGHHPVRFMFMHTLLGTARQLSMLQG